MPSTNATSNTRARRRRSLRRSVPVAVVQGRMDVGRQIEAGGNPVEELQQLHTLGCRERVRDRPLVSDDDVERVLQERLSAAGDGERANAPVAGIRPAFDKPTRL